MTEKDKSLDVQDYGILFLLAWFLSGLVLWFINMGIANFSDLLFTCFMIPAFMVFYVILSINLLVLILFSLFFLVFIPIYNLDELIHIRGMCVGAGFSLFIMVISYFHECFPYNPFPAYKLLRTELIRSCKEFFDRLFYNQQVSPGSFYDRVLYKQLPIYQSTLNNIMLKVLNEDYLCQHRLENLNYEQKKSILDMAEKLNKLGLESGYLLSMLHQYFLCPSNKLVTFYTQRNKTIFLNWAEISVAQYPYDGNDAWQSVLLTYWPSHLGEKRY